jgi:hypothetical protein
VLFAALVAVLHGAAVLFMLSGSLLALRWPRLLWLHVPVSLAILGLYLTGSDCPLTTWELELRAAAGEPGYRGGFIGHYLTEPLGFPIEATSTQVGIYVLAFLPNLIGYGLLAVRGLAATGTGSSGRTRIPARVAGSWAVRSAVPSWSPAHPDGRGTDGRSRRTRVGRGNRPARARDGARQSPR